MSIKTFKAHLLSDVKAHNYDTETWWLFMPSLSFTYKMYMFVHVHGGTLAQQSLFV